MAETKHTPGAERAAEALWKDENRFGPHSCKANYVTKAATIIDRETGLPTLQAKIDRLEAWQDGLEELLRKVCYDNQQFVAKIKEFEAENAKLLEIATERG